MTVTVLTLLPAIIVGFVYSWQLNLLVLACTPFLVAANAVSLSSMFGHAAKDQKALEETGRITFKDNIVAILQLTQLSKIDERGKCQDRIGKGINSCLHSLEICSLAIFQYTFIRFAFSLCKHLINCILCICVKTIFWVCVPRL
uniref:Uncharacterized protein n=1 Tax=Melopsittacus undulatus TaxID=13146 RepID=A0A8C6INF8_MELUD